MGISRFIIRSTSSWGRRVKERNTTLATHSDIRTARNNCKNGTHTNDNEGIPPARRNYLRGSISVPRTIGMPSRSHPLLFRNAVPFPFRSFTMVELNGIRVHASPNPFHVVTPTEARVAAPKNVGRRERNDWQEDRRLNAIRQLGWWKASRKEAFMI